MDIGGIPVKPQSTGNRISFYTKTAFGPLTFIENRRDALLGS